MELDQNPNVNLSVPTIKIDPPNFVSNQDEQGKIDININPPPMVDIKPPDDNLTNNITPQINVEPPKVGGHFVPPRPTRKSHFLPPKNAVKYVNIKPPVINNPPKIELNNPITINQKPVINVNPPIIKDSSKPTISIEPPKININPIKPVVNLNPPSINNNISNISTKNRTRKNKTTANTPTTTKNKR